MADQEPVIRKRERSPAFPFISLRKAVERAQALYENHRREPARLAAIGPSWDYSPKSSGLIQTVAALKQFGLIEDLGSGEDRKVVLTKLGQTIVADQRPGARETALKDAARSSSIISEYLPKWLPDRPSDAHCVSELHLDRGFTEEAAKSFLRIFDETVSFAKLDEEAANSPEAIREVLGGGEDDDMPPSYPRSRAPADGDHSYEYRVELPPRGPRPLNERLKVATDGKTLAVTATLETEGEVEQLIAILNANKLVLPKKVEVPPKAEEGATGAGAVNLD
jgi:hypothetical protein